MSARFGALITSGFLVVCILIPAEFATPQEIILGPIPTITYELLPESEIRLEGQAPEELSGELMLGPVVRGVDLIENIFVGEIVPGFFNILDLTLRSPTVELKQPDPLPSIVFPDGTSVPQGGGGLGVDFPEPGDLFFGFLFDSEQLETGDDFIRVRQLGLGLDPGASLNLVTLGNTPVAFPDLIVLELLLSESTWRLNFDASGAPITPVITESSTRLATVSLSAVPVPEPASIALVGIAAIGLLVLRRLRPATR